MDEKEIKRWAERLTTGPDQMRVMAGQEFVRIADSSDVPSLTQALKDHNKSVRLFAAWALSKIGDASAVPALIETLMDKYWYVRENAVKALARIGKPAVHALIEVLGRSDPILRSEVAETLGKIGEPAVPALTQGLKNHDKHVRVNSAKALVWCVGNCETIKELERLEKAIIESSKTFRKGRDATVRDIEAKATIATALKKISQMKNGLTPERDLLLPDTVKAPKKGDVYNNMRKMQIR